MIWTPLSSLLSPLYLLLSILDQRPHHALHLHETRAFDEQRNVARQRVPDLGLQVLDAGEMARALTESSGCVRRKLAEREHASDAGLARVLTHLRVQSRSLASELAHVAQH